MSSVIERQEDQGNISKMAYNFYPFDRLMQAVGNSTDVCGVIIKVRGVWVCKRDRERGGVGEKRERERERERERIC